MPLFLDTHKVKEVTATAVADAHKKDLEFQGKYGVKFLKYWVDEKPGNVYGLIDAPNAEVAAKGHKKVHGLVADENHEIKEGQ